MKSRNQIINRVKANLKKMGINPYCDNYYMRRIKELVEEGYVREQSRISDKTGNIYYVYSDEEAEIIFRKLFEWSLKRKSSKQIIEDKQITIKELPLKNSVLTSVQIIEKIKKEGITLKNYRSKISDVAKILGINPKFISDNRRKLLFTLEEAERIIKYIKEHTRGQRKAKTKSADIEMTIKPNKDYLRKLENYINSTTLTEEIKQEREDFKDEYIKSLESAIKKLTEDHLELKKKIEQIEQKKPRKKFLGIF